MNLRLLVLSLALGAAAFGQRLATTAVANPSAAGSVQPNWSVGSDGSAVLSWIEPAKGGSYNLRYAVRRGDTWSEVRTVAAGRHFFRHPAETPEVIAVTDKQWFAHWVEMPSEEDEAEFVYVSTSTDGIKWTAPAMAHKDRSKVEHGLASMAASGTEASVLWLEMLKGEDGPAFLMRTVVDANGKEVKEERLDSDVCTCCPTAVAKTAKGLLVAYRDHTAADIRDIAVLRYEGGKWTQPKIVHPDNWKINACPINAATLAARGNNVMLSWYTGAQDAPKVQALFSADGGATFGKPAVLSTGKAYGYTSTAMTADNAGIVSWLELGNAGKMRVMVRGMKQDGSLGPALQVAEGDRQSVGYPRIAQSASGTYLAWSATDGKLQTVRVAQ